MDQQVCYVIGQDENDLYGIACNKRAYMRKKSPQEAWYGIAKEVWEEAKSRTNQINANLVKIENDSKDFKMHGTWGGKYFHFISMPPGLYDWARFVAFSSLKSIPSSSSGNW